jgi:hypothetical protein
MENKMTSFKTYLCALKMFDAKIYLWHLQAFLISGAKIKKNRHTMDFTENYMSPLYFSLV